MIAGLADRQLRFGVVGALQAGQLQRRGRQVDVLRDAQVLNIGFAGAGAATDMCAPAVAHAKAPGEHVDFLCMRLVSRLAIQRADLDEHIQSHSRLISI